MTAPKFFDSYDLETREITEHVLMRMTTVPLFFATKGLAIQAQQRFRGYVKLLSREEQSQLHRSARQLRVSQIEQLEDGQYKLVVSHVQTTPVAMALRTAWEDFKKTPEGMAALEDPK